MTLPSALSPVETLLKQLLAVTNSIAELDLSEVANDSLLLSFRNQQVELRESVNSLTQGTKLTDTEKAIVTQCLAMEALIMDKLHTLQEDNRAQIKMLNNGKLTRNAYQYERALNMSYFVDQHQ
jgi:hypothetical protein